ncbi:hypothetical protein E2C01_067896 [Portunus trituberculatus]|uniref:Uncharacterized protein n=1 Tax=Portunus trituberculatus TaxID=210409 RepID=A0A5B7HQJ4_PORTR|nr:hypothetical protein [Portunus trituberculatus]
MLHAEQISSYVGVSVTSLIKEHLSMFPIEYARRRHNDFTPSPAPDHIPLFYHIVTPTVKELKDVSCM